MTAKNYKEFSEQVNVKFGKNIAKVDVNFKVSLVGKLSEDNYDKIINFLVNHNATYVSYPVIDYNGIKDYIDRESVYFWDNNGNEILHVSKGIGCSALSRIWDESFLKNMHFEVSKNNFVHLT